MASRWSEGRVTWLILGLVAGIGLSTIWPHEPVQAAATDRAPQFAIVSTNIQAQIDPLEGVFTLDFLTGDLKGAVLSRQARRFTTFYYRNVAGDFTQDKNAKLSYAITSGSISLQGAAGATPATSVLYIAELTSGKLNAYGFMWKETPQTIPVQPILPVDSYLFREPLEAE